MRVSGMYVRSLTCGLSSLLQVYPIYAVPVYFVHNKMNVENLLCFSLYLTLPLHLVVQASDKIVMEWYPLQLCAV
jgi:hypothetical protein